MICTIRVLGFLFEKPDFLLGGPFALSMRDISAEKTFTKYGEVAINPLQTNEHAHKESTQTGV